MVFPGGVAVFGEVTVVAKPDGGVVVWDPGRHCRELRSKSRALQGRAVGWAGHTGASPRSTAGEGHGALLRRRAWPGGG